jgi:hypothetical protein
MRANWGAAVGYVRLKEERMTLDPRIRNELERRGPDSVRDLLRAAGPGQGAAIKVQVSGASDPLRSEVEAWLRDKELTIERRETCRFYVIVVLTFIAAVGAVIAALPVIREWFN